jgi:hypothetical protein
VPAEEISITLYELKAQSSKLHILSEPNNPEIEIYNIIDSSDSSVNNVVEEVDTIHEENSTKLCEDIY